MDRMDGALKPLQDKLAYLQQEFDAELKSADTSPDTLERLRLKYLGKKGLLTEFGKNISALSSEDRKDFGKSFNRVKTHIQAQLSELSETSKITKDTPLDGFRKSLPGRRPNIGHLHITTQAIREIVEIFKPLGFVRTRHPEVDWDYFAFEALNMPKTHPARDEWETFFVEASDHPEFGKMVITPHTSSGQIHEMLQGDLPIRMLNISRCGRRQSDLTHIPSFYQFEGLVVDKGINITHLKGVLNYFAKNFFGPDRRIRLRPYDFRFTEPSFEIDVSCGLCHGEGCKFCKGGWLELGGAGMVHPNVLRACNIDPNEYTGFAFGWGVERTYMMKSGTQLDDIRLLLGNDLRFLEQF